MRERTKTPIKRVCDEHGIKYAWMAAQLGISQSMFDHIEAYPPRRTPPPDYYKRASQVLHVPEDMLRPEPDGVVA